MRTVKLICAIVVIVAFVVAVLLGMVVTLDVFLTLGVLGGAILVTWAIVHVTDRMIG